MPPLNLLRTFEAAVRLGSFARAAAELHVTPSAVSQQMRALEARVGVPLFVRSARRLTVTRAGREYAESVGRAIAGIEAATLALGRPERSGRLNITTFYSFAALWLLPRLGRFRAMYPEIDVHLRIGSDVVDIASGGADVGLRYGMGEYPGCVAERLMGDTALPVCRPSLLAGQPAPRRPADLAELPLLQDDGLFEGERTLMWSDWLGGATPRKIIHMPDGLLSLTAALLGQGVALVRRSSAEDDLRAGRLLPLMDEEKQTISSYWLVTAAGDRSARVEAFREWLLADMAAIPTASVRTIATA